jgi:hypothetical protein
MSLRVEPDLPRAAEPPRAQILNQQPELVDC